MFKKLSEVCKSSIARNCHQTSRGIFISAGGHQFKTLWIRDFCFSVPGLLLAGHKDLVREQLNLIISLRRPNDSLIPRGIDTIPPQIRVGLHTLGRFLPSAWKDRSLAGLLKPEYLGEHRTPSFDSNLLLILAATKLAAHEPEWFLEKTEVWLKAIQFYQPYFSSGLIKQPAYSDWQDSAKRQGQCLYLNLLYLLAHRALNENGLPVQEFSDFEDLLFKHFFDPTAGLFRNKSNEERFSLETQLWIIENRLFLKFITPEQLYLNLKKHPLWTQFEIPGVPIWPPYADSEISWTTRLVGLRGYHDQLHWSWLIGESAKICFFMQDHEEGQRILNQIELVAIRTKTIHEIYTISENELVPYRSWLYVSESPFTWGAAKIIEAISHCFSI